MLLFAAVVAVSLCAQYVYTRKPLNFSVDAAYYWPVEKVDVNEWKYEELPAGYKTYFYLPEKYRSDRDNESARLPLVVVFHGSDEKWSSLSKYGKGFVTDAFQKRIYPEGTAVLVVLSRANYFTDPHSMSLLIQNVCIRNPCIDRAKIIGYGFSQGAKFVVELACHEPRLFMAVISGSGFYQMKLRELVTVLPVRFYFATSEDDKGIFEQGSATGRLCAKWCLNSRYVEYKTRRHFWVEFQDKTGRKNKDGTDESFLDWLAAVVAGE